MADFGEDPKEAAIRELKEETGFEGNKVIEIGRVESNPAIMSNHTYTYLVLDCKKSSDQNLDGTEDIEIIFKKIDDIPSLIKNREIEHALVISAFYFYNLYIQN
jgi:8-oxo-dGTP pyrophosphatase MutT (NUDIX family)